MAKRTGDGQGLTRRTFAVGAAALLITGCFGSFGATNALYDWNERVSGNKWIRWLVFLVLVILPVYGLFILADALVLNTIEFFTGKNPVGRTKLGAGRSLRTSRTPDQNLVKHELEEGGRVVRTLYVRRIDDSDLQLLDDRMRLVGRAKLKDDGSVDLVDAQGRTISKVSPDQVDQAATAMDEGLPPTQAVARALEPSESNEALARRTD